jgi:hypothetical protein
VFSVGSLSDLEELKLSIELTEPMRNDLSTFWPQLGQKFRFSAYIITFWQEGFAQVIVSGVRDECC